MTKKIIILAMAIITGITAFAEVSLGIDANIGSGVSTVRAGSFEETYGSTDKNLNTLAGFDISCQINIGENSSRFFVRPEAGILFNNGIGNGFRFTYEDHTLGVTNDSDCIISVSTVEIPVLLGMETDLSGWTLDYYAGPYVSIPFAGSVTTAAGVSKLNYSLPVFGAAAGITGNLKAGPGTVIMDMRYLFDLASTKMKMADTGNSVSLYARRNIVLSAGYKLSL